ncbi:nicotinate phosphoribosyltransferase [Breoghania sp.]|uniref:nicotinate phosphoribosyltransferase n=1 Tax=Breoghania sp. TaxID=2065378 RepID=UPI0026146210|nr:nicotinate phosphoribosyltransferase [Breoghania sp.]MDJ0932966.1 nicotinate phosphoribosyltransferase [Breoghania sp.]
MADTLSKTDFGHSLLVTDLYQLNMLEAYRSAGMDGTAIFEFFVRCMPKNRGFLMSAGLEQLIGFLLGARVDQGEIDWLRQADDFYDQLAEYLTDFRFTGHVDAVPEGSVVFAHEPLVRITAPVAEAQLIETRLINFLQFQTLVATKAARMMLAAPGKGIVDFGLRRAHSGESGILAARAAYLAGFNGTTSVPAGRHFDIPLYGTMAHSFVQTFTDEIEAFRAFAVARPEQTVFLLDTYEIERAARRLVELASKLHEQGIRLKGVRIDSGDLADHARKVRKILDDGGLGHLQIVASGGLDEYELAKLIAKEAPIDFYGVGTSLVTSDDLPSLDCGYKLKVYEGTAQRKLAEGKSYWPGATQVWRTLDADGLIAGDRITGTDEIAPGEPLLKPILRDGALVEPLPTLDEIRTHATNELAHVPEAFKRLENTPDYPITVSPALRALAEDLEKEPHGRSMEAC